MGQVQYLWRLLKISLEFPSTWSRVSVKFFNNQVIIIYNSWLYDTVFSTNNLENSILAISYFVFVHVDNLCIIDIKNKSFSKFAIRFTLLPALLNYSQNPYFYILDYFANWVCSVHHRTVMHNYWQLFRRRYSGFSCLPQLLFFFPNIQFVNNYRCIRITRGDFEEISNLIKMNPDWGNYIARNVFVHSLVSWVFLILVLNFLFIFFIFF